MGIGRANPGFLPAVTPAPLPRRWGYTTCLCALLNASASHLENGYEAAVVTHAMPNGLLAVVTVGVQTLLIALERN